MIGRNLFARLGEHKAHGAAEISVEAFLRDCAGSDVQVVDVREPDEWAGAHIPGSVLMPMGEVPFRLRELDPSRPVVTVCRSGQRSLYSADALLASGFKDVKSLAGGMIAWVEAGQPVEY